MLATLDPLAALAGSDEQALKELLGSVEDFADGDLGDFLEELGGKTAEPASNGANGATSDEFSESFQVLVTCENEAQQRELLARLDSEGYSVRALIV